jgi:hypothetical protein
MQQKADLVGYLEAGMLLLRGYNVMLQCAVRIEECLHHSKWDALQKVKVQALGRQRLTAPPSDPTYA